MPKFEVSIDGALTVSTIIEIEAPTESEARSKALELAREDGPELFWENGETVREHYIFNVESL